MAVRNNTRARLTELSRKLGRAATLDDVPDAGAVITYFIPGLRFFHQEQFEGRKKRITPHLVRAPEESPKKEFEEFYDHYWRMSLSGRSRLEHVRWPPLSGKGLSVELYGELGPDLPQRVEHLAVTVHLRGTYGEIFAHSKNKRGYKNG